MVEANREECKKCRTSGTAKACCLNGKTICEVLIKEKQSKKLYAFSFNGEHYNNETFASREKALKYVKKNWKNYVDVKDLLDGDLTIYIGEANYYKENIDVEDIITRMQEEAWDNVGERAETFLDDISKEQKGILERRLNKIWNNFKKEFGIKTDYFFTVPDEETYVFNIYSKEFKYL